MIGSTGFSDISTGQHTIEVTLTPFDGAKYGTTEVLTSCNSPCVVKFPLSNGLDASLWVYDDVDELPFDDESNKYNFVAIKSDILPPINITVPISNSVHSKYTQIWSCTKITDQGKSFEKIDDSNKIVCPRNLPALYECNAQILDAKQNCVVELNINLWVVWGEFINSYYTNESTPIQRFPFAQTNIFLFNVAAMRGIDYELGSEHETILQTVISTKIDPNTGKLVPDYYPGAKMYNGVLHRFRISPVIFKESYASNHFNIDITREKQFALWTCKGGNWKLNVSSRLDEWDPDDNDNPLENIDESTEPSAEGYIYSFDIPGFYPRVENHLSVDEYVLYANFREFVRFGIRNQSAQFGFEYKTFPEVPKQEWRSISWFSAQEENGVKSVNRRRNMKIFYEKWGNQGKAGDDLNTISDGQIPLIHVSQDPSKSWPFCTK